MVKEVISIAEESSCKKIVLITTNDNINAIRFYQKRGFDMAHLYRNALEVPGQTLNIDANDFDYQTDEEIIARIDDFMNS